MGTAAPRNYSTAVLNDPRAIAEAVGINGSIMTGGWLTEREADRIACHLGTHIDLLWPHNAWIDRYIDTDLDDLLEWVEQWMCEHGCPPHRTDACGTVTGHTRHRRAGINAAYCTPCKTAFNRYTRRMKQQSRERLGA